MILVNVQAGGGEHAIKTLKRKMQRELVFRAMKNSRHYEPPSIKRIRKKEESDRRRRKLMRKRLFEE